MEKQNARKPWARWLSGALATAMVVTLLPDNALLAKAAKAENSAVTVHFNAVSSTAGHRTITTSTALPENDVYYVDAGGTAYKVANG